MGMLHHIRTAYGDLKLQTKLTLVLLLLLSIPAVAVGVFFYTQFREMVVTNTIREEQNNSAQMVPMVDSVLKEVHAAEKQLEDLAFFSELFHNPVNTPLAALLSSEKADRFRRDAGKILEDSILTGFRIYIDLPALTFPEQTDEEIFRPLSSARTYWRGIFAGTGAKDLHCPPFYLGSIERSSCGDEAYIRATTLYYKGRPVTVYLAYYYSSQVYVDMLNSSLVLKESVSYIINDRDSIVAASDESLVGIYLLEYNDVENSYMSSTSFVRREILDKNVYAGYFSINEPRWFLVTVLPLPPMLEKGTRVLIGMGAIYGVFLILAFLVASLMSRSFTNRISSVISRMRYVRTAPPVPMEDPEYHDEIGELIDTYNYMARRMNLLVAQQARSAEDLRIAEFRSLQAQINPHFLYNTMDMINWMAKQGKTEEISAAVQSLSKFYRLTLSRKKSMSTIAEEQEHISIYVRLQNMRFHDSIELICDIPDELMDYSIPSLTLQPVIENAILHGIQEKESKSGTIVLTGWMEDGEIVLLISDDGVGIPPEKLSTILTGEGKSPSGGTNIAVFNTHRRLQLLYGPEYGLTYRSEDGNGTEVEIRIPAILDPAEINNSPENDSLLQHTSEINNT